jgi:hypothetical protein
VTVQDVFGFKIVGAQVKMILPYGDVHEQTIDKTGTALFTSVPRGKFSISVTNIGFTTTLDGDASLKNEVTIVVPISTNVLAVGVILIAVLGIIIYLKFIKRPSKQTLPPPPPMP